MIQAQETYYLANGSYAKNLQQLDVEIPNFPCSISSGITGITCSLYIRGEKILEYHQRFLHSDRPNLRLCRAYSLDIKSLPNQICQTDTRSATGLKYFDEYMYWMY